MSIDVDLKRTHPHYQSIAQRCNLLGERDEALKWLEKALEIGILDMPRINSDPIFKNLRSEPRFQALLKKMNLAN